MPRKSKDELKEQNIAIKDVEVKTKNPKTTKKKVSEKTENITKTSRRTTKSKANKAQSKVEVEEKASTKSSTKISKAEKTTTKKSTTKKTTANKSTTKRAANQKAKTTTQKNISSTVEYYDLPYRYNETVVKILAQTPNMLFIYWDISDLDRNSYIEKYGNDFFNNTKPILLIHNKTMNYTFEVEINDFANSWYLHVNDANCDYSVELGRRPIYNNRDLDDYFYIVTSNEMEMPNNHVLLDKLGKFAFFKNVKNNFIEKKEITSLSFIKNLGKVYTVYDLYKEMYKNELNEDHDVTLKLDLSSSNSSTFK